MKFSFIFSSVLLSTALVSSVFAQTLSGDTASDAITYSKDIRPRIFEKVCSACHNSASPIPNWLDYKIAFAKSAAIYERVIVKHEMPPPASGLTLSQEEISLLEEWVDSGSPY